MGIRSLVFIGFSILSGFSSVFAQAITGKVVDATTKDALPFATVYLANTTIGTTSNESGDFTLRNISTGRHTLSVSFVGYINTSVEIEMKQDSTIDITLEMQQSTMILDEVEIVEDLSKRKRYLEIFKEEFLGTSQNARRSSVLNEEEIYFKESEEGKVLEAFADRPIEIENKSLGYKIYYDLVRFKLDKSNKVLVQFGTARFVELKENTRKSTKKRRREVYQGSLMHFFRSVFSDDKIKNYEIRPLYRKIIGPLKLGNKIYYDGDTLSVTEFEKISARKSINISKEPKYEDTIGEKLKKQDFVFYDRGICYMKGGLYFIVFNGSAIPGFNGKSIPGYSVMGERAYKPTSNLIIRSNQIRVFENGAVDKPTALYTEGYWSWFEKVGTMLPMDYEPE